MSTADGIRQKIGIEFEKEEWSRFYSHHDMLRFFERMVARAELPVRRTKGFNPRPRIVFASPLSLGVASKNEHVEIELDEVIPLQELEKQLLPLMLPGMRITRISQLPPKRKSRHVVRCTYRLLGWNLDDEVRQTLDSKVEELLATEAITLTRLKKNSPPRSVNIAPSLEDLRVDNDGVVAVIKEIAGSTAKPGEISTLLCNACQADPDSISIIRTKTEVAF